LHEAVTILAHLNGMSQSARARSGVLLNLLNHLNHLNHLNQSIVRHSRDGFREGTVDECVSGFDPRRWIFDVGC
jgi:hypothetical protein